ERLAQAEATATRVVAEAARAGGEPALRYFISDRYIQAFQALAATPTSRLVVVPMELAGIAGGILTAVQLLKEPGDLSSGQPPVRAASSVPTSPAPQASA